MRPSPAKTHGFVLVPVFVDKRELQRARPEPQQRDEATGKRKASAVANESERRRKDGDPLVLTAAAALEDDWILFLLYVVVH